MKSKLKTLLQSKQKTISRETGYPSQKSGRDGDFQVRKIEGQGIFLFYKWHNKWYSSRLTQYRPRTSEHKEPVKIPMGVEPSSIGSIAMDTDGLIKVRKTRSNKSQMVAMNTSKVLDIKEVRLERAETTDMDDNNSKTPDWVIENTGHVHLQLHNPAPAAGSAFDSYISFSRLHPETFNLTRWIMGFDVSAGNFVWNYKSDSTSGSTRDYVVDTPSTTANMKMQLTATGALTIANSLHIGSVAAITSDTDKFLVLDGAEVKYVTGDTLIPDILTAGTNCSFSGSTLNVDDAFIKNDTNDTMAGTLAITSTTADQFKVLYDGSNYGLINVADDGHVEIESVGTDADMTLNAAGDIELNADGGNVNIKDGAASHFLFDCDNTRFTIYDDTDAADLFSITVGASGATTLATVDDGAAVGHLTLDVDGDIELNADGGQVKITDDTVTHFMFNCDTTRMVIYDDTDTSDYLSISVAANGVSTIATNDNDGAVGHLNIEPDGHVEFDGCGVGFDKETATFSTSGEIGDGNDSTDVDFRLGNKFELTLTDNISGSSEFINMIFPATSGNFILALIQDGTGSRTVASAGWVAYAHDETLCDNLAGTNGTDGLVRWAGGTAPILTTTANKTDIISIYWDSDNQTAFATITYNF